MKRALGSLFLGLFLVGNLQAATVQTAEAWKGTAPVEQWSFSVMSGLGIGGGSQAFGLLGSAAHKINDRGFAPDLNNQVYIEFTMGPYFFSRVTSLFASFHLRWDFHRDEDWSLYALGGGATLIPTGVNTGGAEFYPRFGIGAMAHLANNISIRGELSHEFIGAGVMFWL